MVPWLQTTAVAVKLPPGITLAGPVMEETIRSGLFPIPIWVPAFELLPSFSSMVPFQLSAMAPRYHRPLLGALAHAFTETVTHAPGERPGTGALPARESPVVMASSD